MPFDGSNFGRPRRPPQPPRMSRGQERALLLAIGFLLLLLLALPVPFTALLDLASHSDPRR